MVRALCAGERRLIIGSAPVAPGRAFACRSRLQQSQVFHFNRDARLDAVQCDQHGQVARVLGRARSVVVHNPTDAAVAPPALRVTAGCADDLDTSPSQSLCDVGQHQRVPRQGPNTFELVADLLPLRFPQSPLLLCGSTVGVEGSLCGAEARRL